MANVGYGLGSFMEGVLGGMEASNRRRESRLKSHYMARILKLADMDAATADEYRRLSGEPRMELMDVRTPGERVYEWGVKRIKGIKPRRQNRPEEPATAVAPEDVYTQGATASERGLGAIPVPTYAVEPATDDEWTQGYASGNYDDGGVIPTPDSAASALDAKAARKEKTRSRVGAVASGLSAGLHASDDSPTAKMSDVSSFLKGRASNPQDTEFAEGGSVARTMQEARGTATPFGSQATGIPQTTMAASGAAPIPSVTGPVDTGYFADAGLVGRDYNYDSRRASGMPDESSDVAVLANIVDAPPRVPGQDIRLTAPIARSPIPTPAPAAVRPVTPMRNAPPAALDVERPSRPPTLSEQAIPLLRQASQENLGSDPQLAGLRAAGDITAAGKIAPAPPPAPVRATPPPQKKGAAMRAGKERAIPEAPPTATPAPSGGPAVGPPATQAAQAPPGKVDFSKVNWHHSDVPNVTTDEWRDLRQQAIRAEMMGGHGPESWQKANDAITNMQMTNFNNYLSQAQMLLRAGNQKGAMAAMRAGFQFFPNGHDVEFGTWVDPRTGQPQIIGFGVDENTHEPVPGSEIVITNEYLDNVRDNFARPGAFVAWTKDHREMDYKLAELHGVREPLAQAGLAEAGAKLTAAANAGGGAGVSVEESRLANLTRNAPALLNVDPEGADWLIASVQQLFPLEKRINPNVNVDALMLQLAQEYRKGRSPQEGAALVQQWVNQRYSRAPQQQPTQALPTP